MLVDVPFIPIQESPTVHPQECILICHSDQCLKNFLHPRISTSAPVKIHSYSQSLLHFLPSPGLLTLIIHYLASIGKNNEAVLVHLALLRLLNLDVDFAGRYKV